MADDIAIYSSMLYDLLHTGVTECVGTINGADRYMVNKIKVTDDNASFAYGTLSITKDAVIKLLRGDDVSMAVYNTSRPIHINLILR